MDEDVEASVATPVVRDTKASEASESEWVLTGAESGGC